MRSFERIYHSLKTEENRGFLASYCLAHNMSSRKRSRSVLMRSGDHDTVVRLRRSGRVQVSSSKHRVASVLELADNMVEALDHIVFCMRQLHGLYLEAVARPPPRHRRWEELKHEYYDLYHRLRQFIGNQNEKVWYCITQFMANDRRWDAFFGPQNQDRRMKLKLKDLVTVSMEVSQPKQAQSFGSREERAIIRERAILLKTHEAAWRKRNRRLFELQAQLRPLAVLQWILKSRDDDDRYFIDFELIMLFTPIPEFFDPDPKIESDDDIDSNMD